MARNYDVMIRNVLINLIWKAEIRHEGLNKYRVIRRRDRDVVEQMAETKIVAWNEMWKVENGK